MTTLFMKMTIFFITLKRSLGSLESICPNQAGFEVLVLCFYLFHFFVGSGYFSHTFNITQYEVTLLSYCVIFFLAQGVKQNVTGYSVLCVFHPHILCVFHLYLKRIYFYLPLGGKKTIWPSLLCLKVWRENLFFAKAVCSQPSRSRHKDINF